MNHLRIASENRALRYYSWVIPSATPFQQFELFLCRFAINPKTGELTVAAPLDYEATQEYLVGVAANDGAYRAQTTVTIDVLDTNDNAPEFNRESYHFSVMQGQDMGYSVGTVAASDDDADNGPNGQFFYR